MRGIISWNGERSDQYGIMVEKVPALKKPQRKFDKYTVPGRNGDIIMMQDAWENVEQQYDIFAGSFLKLSAPGAFSRVAAWLYTPKGYCELWDDFDPEHFRWAYFSGPFDVETLSIGRVGRTTISFICKPQRYLVSGKNQITVSASPVTIHNPTAYNAKPLLLVKQSADGDGTVTVNGTVFSITGIPATGVYIDCEEMNCYGQTGNNLNSIVSSNSSEFASLSPGDNAIGFSGNVAEVVITPRWFEL